MFVDTAELMRQVPEQTQRYRAAEAVGSNCCQESLGRLVGILEKLVDNQLTQKQLKKSELALVTDKAQCYAFPGCRTQVHRAGTFAEGERGGQSG